MLRNLGINRSLPLRTTVRTFASSGRCLNTAKGSHPLNWEGFLKLRKEHKIINIGTSIGAAFASTVVAWGYVSQLEINPTEMIFGFDPFAVYIAGMMVISGVGYMFGPFFGDAVFSMKNRALMKEFNRKRAIFLQHIKKNRVDASRQSYTNPVPDYYGEKIGSLGEYRQWLRDCNAYKRKTEEFL